MMPSLTEVQEIVMVSWSLHARTQHDVTRKLNQLRISDFESLASTIIQITDFDISSRSIQGIATTQLRKKSKTLDIICYFILLEEKVIESREDHKSQLHYRSGEVKYKPIHPTGHWASRYFDWREQSGQEERGASKGDNFKVDDGAKPFKDELNEIHGAIRKGEMETAANLLERLRGNPEASGVESVVKSCDLYEANMLIRQNQDSQRAEELVRGAIKYYEKSGDQKEHSQCLYFLSHFATRKNNIEEAMALTRKGLELIENVVKATGVRFLHYTNLAWSYHGLGEFEKSLWRSPYNTFANEPKTHTSNHNPGDYPQTPLHWICILCRR